MQIDSPTNPLIKEIAALHQRKERESQGLLLVEGQHPIEEALAAGLTLHHLFLQEGASQDFAGAIAPTWVSPRAMAKLATTESPPPCVAVVRTPQLEPEGLFSVPTPFVLVLVGLQDPGNVGTLLRAAAAFGVTGILATPGTVDLYSPKVIRSAAGILFRLPLLQTTAPLEETLAGLQEKGLKLFCTTGHEMNHASYRAVSYQGACGVVLGNEGAGLPSAVFEPPNTGITIPMAPGIESLNVGVSGSIILAEAAAQRGLAALG